MQLSLITPTYNEKENVPKLLSQLIKAFDQNKIDAEIIVVDDNSPDGTGNIVENLKTQYPNLKTIHRKGKLGLSSAVIEGFSIAEGHVVGVMDADLSHPAEKINEMLESIESGSDLVIGSRYVKGGTIKGWNLYRKILSKGATLLARVFTKVEDPMSGFFLLKKELVLNREINPRGFKLLLEILIKVNCKKITEIPITFTNRTTGISKAGIKEIMYYLKNLLGYLPYTNAVVMEFIKFSFVGLIGTIINISILYLLTEQFGIYYIISALVAFIIAVTTNFFFNKIWTFREKIQEKIVGKYTKFFLVSLLALLINLCVLYMLTEFLGIYYIFSQVIAIGISLMINFIGNKIWTFRT